ncbi:MAG: YqgE/AlgH family protein [Flavobacteriales bacterium]|nr:YqgE/AlgH family protein [Flavobacteriales bacterium]
MELNPFDFSMSALNKLSLKEGRLLVSEPFMNDPNFKRSVILLAEHKPEGSIGFILNQPLNINVNDALRDFPIVNSPVFMGGPVQNDSMFFIHSQGNIIEDSVAINDNLYWSGNYESLKSKIEEQLIFPHEIMFFVGYSGWGYEQLQYEIKNNSWFIADSFGFSLNDFKSEHLWQKVLQKQGPKHAMIANFPEDPNLN